MNHHWKDLFDILFFPKDVDSIGTIPDLDENLFYGFARQGKGHGVLYPSHDYGSATIELEGEECDHHETR